jgi:hypothetical protein
MVISLQIWHGFILITITIPIDTIHLCISIGLPMITRRREVITRRREMTKQKKKAAVLAAVVAVMMMDLQHQFPWSGGLLLRVLLM